MRCRYFTLFCILASVHTTLAQTSPYAGQEQHKIKALSPKEVEEYFNGAGMGYAKAAELNSYPGPKHVLELADKLQLSEEQAHKANDITQAMKSDAVRLGQAIVHQEYELNKLFASKTIDPATLKDQTELIAKLQGELRAVHLSAHLGMRQVLTETQIMKYDELRGYSKQGDAIHDNKVH